MVCISKLHVQNQILIANISFYSNKKIDGLPLDQKYNTRFLGITIQTVTVGSS